MVAGRVRLLVLLALLGVCAVPVSAAAGSCAGPPTVSALGQYCENVPAAGGGHTPGPGTPALSSTLPPRIAHAIAARRGAAAAHKLLLLPAADATPGRPAGAAPAHVSEVSLVLPLLLVLLAIALVLAVAAAAGARRRRRLRTA